MSSSTVNSTHLLRYTLTAQALTHSPLQEEQGKALKLKLPLF